MYTDEQLLTVIHAAHDRKLANVVQLLSSMPGVLEQDDELENVKTGLIRLC
jgi:hypothetical protein